MANDRWLLAARGLGTVAVALGDSTRIQRWWGTTEDNVVTWYDTHGKIVARFTVAMCEWVATFSITEQWHQFGFSLAKAPVDAR